VKTACWRAYVRLITAKKENCQIPLCVAHPSVNNALDLRAHWGKIDTMLTRALPVEILLALLFWGPAVAQTVHDGKMLSIKNPQLPGITIAPYSSAGLAPELDPLSGGGSDITRLRQYSVVIMNGTAKPIRGITVRWTWRDLAGQVKVHDLRSDGLFLVSRDLVPPNGRILLAPGTVFPIETARTNYVGPPLRAGGDIETFERASGGITAALDTVVFADGEVTGPDESRTMDYIQARTAAAQSLGRSVLALLREGKDPSAHLSQIKNRGIAGKDDYLGLWSFRLAERLLVAPDRKQRAEQLLEIATPTLFRR